MAARRTLLPLCVLIAACSLLALGSTLPAGAAALNPAGDCYANQRLTQSYSIPELQQAIAHMPSTEAEYTTCPDIIQTQLNTQLAQRKLTLTKTANSGGSFMPTWLIVVLVVFLAAGAGGTVAATRRRSDGS